jgi:putative ABC transport system permease protein
MAKNKASASDRIFRALLRAFPAEFRWRFGKEMEQGFRQERKEQQGGKRSALIMLWVRAVIDIISTAPGEHLDILKKDAGYGLRTMRRNPGFTLVAVLALALGVGANTAIFSVVNSVLLRPLPYRDAETIVVIKEWTPRGQGQVTPANFLDWREQNKVFEGMAAISTRRANLTGYSTEPQRINLAVASANLFQVLGVQPLSGRGFLPPDEQAGHDPVAVVSYGLWQRRFGSDAGLVGQPLKIDGANYTVVGIMPAHVQYPKDVDVWIPPRRIVPEADVDLGDITQIRGFGLLSVVARLKPGVTLAQSQADMDDITGRLREQYPESNGTRFDTVISLHDSLFGEVRTPLLVLLAAVGAVLIIACANVANLLLARSSVRQKEIAVRTALGASRLRIVRQLMTESMLLALIGGAAGLVVGVLSLNLLVRLAPSSIPRVEEIGLDRWVLGYTLLISVITGMVFGLAPALQVTKGNFNEALKEGARGMAGGARHISLRGALVVAEVALSLVLLICAGLLFRSFLILQNVDPGFNPKNILTMRLAPSGDNYRDVNQRNAFYRRVIERIETLPEVKSVGAISTLAFSKGPTAGYVIEGQPPITFDQMPGANRRHISPAYFRTMSIPLLSGREFTDRDDADAPGVAIINQALARREFSDKDPVGQRIAFRWRNSQPVWLEIVGVAGDIRSIELQAEPMAEAYTPYLQNEVPEMSFVISAATDPTSLASAVRAEIGGLDGEQPVSNIKTMDQIISEVMTQPQFNTLMLGIFSGIAMLLALGGIYAVMAYSVAQRTHEIGIRMALGARPRDVLKMMVAQGARLTAAGIIIGVWGALVATRGLATLLFGVSPTDPLTFAGIALLLGAVSLLASYVPALRAAKVDPMTALRQE